MRETEKRKDNKKVEYVTGNSLFFKGGMRVKGREIKCSVPRGSTGHQERAKKKRGERKVKIERLCLVLSGDAQVFVGQENY